MITEQERIDRARYLGASDMPIIMGEATFGDELAVWASKTNQYDPDLKPKSNAAQSLGNRMEPIILDLAEQELGPIQRGGFFELPAAHLGAHTDGVLQFGPSPVEAKWVSRMSPDYELWGADGTDECPPHVLIQVMTQMICMGNAKSGHVSALVGGDPHLYAIEWFDALANKIVEYADQWWESYVVPYLQDGTLIPPSDDRPRLDVLKRFRRKEGLRVRVPKRLVTEWRDLREQRLAVEKLEEAAQARILLQLRSENEWADEAEYGEEGKILSYRKQRSAPAIDRDAMKRDGLYEKYARQGMHRVLRIAKD